MKELVNTEAKDLLSSFKNRFWMLAKNFVEENEGESKEAHGGGMRKCKKQ